MTGKLFLRDCISYFFVEPLKFLCGIRIYKNLFPQNGVLHVLSYQGIGDSIVTYGFLKKYMKKTGFLKASIHYIPRLKELTSFYDFDFAEFRELSEKNYIKLKRFFCTKRGLSFLLSRKDILFTDTVAFTQRLWEKTFLTTKRTVYDYIRDCIMSLDRNAFFTKPKIHDLTQKEILKKYNLNGKKKIAVLNPFSNTIKYSGNAILFERIAKLLLELNFFVFTDCGTDTSHKPIFGTKAFYGTLTESFSLCKVSEWIIGIRSGWFDLMCFTNGNLVAIYADNHPSARNAFNLEFLTKELGCEAKIFQLTFSDSENEIKKLLDA